MQSNFNRYHAEVLRILDKFKRANEWSDFIEPLDSLCSTFKRYNAGYIPCVPQLIKRLNQLLNPALPGGVHMKTIECYDVIFEYTSKENLIKDFDVLTLGLFNFSVNCKIVVADSYLSLISRIIEVFGSKLNTFAKHILFALLPFLESESSDFYSKAYPHLTQFLEKISEKCFYTALWENFIDNPDLRVPILNFLTKHRSVVIPDHGLVAKAFSVGLEVDNPFVIRAILDMSNRDFPYIVETISISPTQPKIKNKGRKLDALPVDELTENNSPSIGSVSETISSQASEQKSQQIIKDLDSSDDTNEKEKENANTGIIRGVLKIFLKKEVGMHKRAYKWLNVLDTITEKDIDYIEKGLRAYLNGNEDDLSVFFRIINTMGDRENLAVYLMERLILDAIFALLKYKRRNQEAFYFVRKNVKSFLNNLLDEFYRVIYMGLEKALASLEKYEPPQEKEYSEDTSTTDTISLTTGEVETNNAEKLMELVIYAFFDLDAVDLNVTSIHIPLLCHLIIRNKKKISPAMFFRFMNVFVDRCEVLPDSQLSPVSQEMIDSFYRKESQALLEINLISALAMEMGKLEIYDENQEDPVFWTDSDLRLQDGMLIWTNLQNIHRINRERDFLNFRTEDIKILQKFIHTHGYKGFPGHFLEELGRYLSSNYIFPELMKELSFCINEDVLVLNLWNDFIKAKNAKYVMYFPEEKIRGFVIEKLPEVGIKDACLFLEEGLRSEKHYEVLFRVATVIDYRSSEFTSLLLNLDGTIRFIENILERYYEENEDPYGYNATMAVLLLVEILLDNTGFMKEIKENVDIKIKGEANEENVEENTDENTEIKLQEALIRMVFDVMDTVFIPEDGLGELSVDTMNYQYNSKESSATENLTLGNTVQSTINDHKRIYRLVFNILFKLYKMGITIFIPDVDRVREIIRASRYDFYIMKRSLFLVMEDVEFVFNNYLHFYRPMFSQINRMAIKERFFSHLVYAGKTKVEIMQEALPYIMGINSIKKEDLYSKCIELIEEDCKASTSLYKRKGKKYIRISNGGDKFKEALTEEEVVGLINEEPTTLVLIKAGKLSSSISLATSLFLKNPNLFVTSISCNSSQISSFLYIFGAMPFKEEIYVKILMVARNIKFPSKVLTDMTKMLSTEMKSEIIKAKADFLRSNFGSLESNIEPVGMLLELFRSDQSDLSRVIVSNILHSLTSSAELLIRVSSPFSEELKLLRRIIKFRMATGQSINLLRNCCFTILSTRLKQEALSLISLYFNMNPSCRIFIDAFTGYFYKNFFDFGLSQKIKIFSLLSSSASFEPFSIINTLISRMETSIFSTAQNEEHLRVTSIKRMAFLILSQPANKFSSMSDVFVRIINNLINSSSDVRAEVIRFSTVLMLKIDNHHLQTLFPILVADFMVSVFTKDIKVVLEIFRFIDTSIWLKSSVFTFKVLFGEEHSFYLQLKSHLSYECDNDLTMDMSGPLPNFFTLAYQGKLDSWGQVGAYFKESKKYYDYIDLHIVDKDYGWVEESLALTFSE